jgi:hypothetical protein
MWLLAFLVAVTVGAIVWSAMTRSPERYPPSTDRRDFDVRRRGSDV